MLKRLLRVPVRRYHPSSSEYVKSPNLGPLNYGKDSPQYAVLSHALKVSVPVVGFNERALVHSLNQLNYPSTMLSVLGASNSPSLFHSSPAVMELIKFHLVDKRLRLVEDLDQESQQKPSLEDLLLKRLEMNVPVAQHLSQLLSHLAIPGPFTVEAALPELHRLSDDLIYYSSEKDHPDFAWYSKRIGLSCAYVSSELFMAQDSSANYEETFEFAKDKLERTMQLGEYYNNTEEWAWYTLLNTINLAKSQMARG
ncbi:probable Ubiquinone biosynthesis protein COQ9,mitochondrial [Zygosaccharomyces bailii ISA1307]|nr:probable Ubiquinone biosynthesis protein COQ9,mitochondrial [Zygosaccharomyces bailii ISA1307]